MSQSEEDALELTQDDFRFPSQPKLSKPKPQHINKWKIYCSRRGKKSTHKDYIKNIQQVGSFNTIDGFFSYFAAIKEPSELQVDTKLFCFLHDCQPLWEEWLDSGELYLTVKHYKDKNKGKLHNDILDRLWEYLIFSMVGNTLPTTKQKQEKRGEQELIGICLSKRQKASLIEVWYRSDTNAMQLSKQIENDILKELSSIESEEKVSVQIRYKRHKDSIMTNSTMKGSYNIRNSLSESF